MKKKQLTLFVIVVLLLVVVLPVQAEREENVAGLWQYQPFILSVEEHSCNQFLTTFENGTWSIDGTTTDLAFEGSSTEDGKVVIHCNGDWSFNAIVSFVGEIGGASGSLTMSVNGLRPEGDPDWFGRWTIISGTEGLENLHGQGTFWGPGAPAPGEWGDIWYEGKVRFSPG